MSSSAKKVWIWLKHSFQSLSVNMWDTMAPTQSGSVPHMYCVMPRTELWSTTWQEKHAKFLMSFGMEKSTCKKFNVSVTFGEMWIFVASAVWLSQPLQLSLLETSHAFHDTHLLTAVTENGDGLANQADGKIERCANFQDVWSASR